MQRSSYKLPLIALVFLSICVLIYSTWSSNTKVLSSQGNQHNHNTQSSYYHLLLPASEASAGLCKTIFSAAVLGYPTPRLLNWQRKFEDEHLIFGGSHVAKIEGVLGFLRQLEPQHDDELVSIVDGYDVWFQLRPEVVISRYNEINKRANYRIRSRLGIKDAEENNVKQTVVFSAQKKCWPASPDDAACFAVPQSELAADIYGPQTDHDIDDEKNPFAKMRQRYLNSGTVIGPVGDVRAIFERAAEKALVSTNFGSDQGIFAEIFGEQEYQRELIRAQNLSRLQRIFLALKRVTVGLSELDDVTSPHPTHHGMNPATPGGRNYEFHIGLDYGGELSQPTVFSENDLAWLKHKDINDIRDKSTMAGMEGKVRVKGLPGDVAASTPPFWASDVASAANLPTSQTWEDMAVYTNLWTGTTPVAIHHNAHHDGLKTRIQTFWNETWYFPHLRELLHASARDIRAPVAVLENSGVQHEWWDPTDERGGARVEIGSLPGDWIGWQDMCGTTEITDEVFRDGKGAWNDPIVFLSWDHGVAEEQVARWRESHKSSTNT